MESKSTMDIPESSPVSARIIAAFVAEAAAPEILLYEFDLVEEVTRKLGTQKEWNIPSTTDDIQERAIANTYQMEVDRIKYSLTCYLRTRIQKIERHARYIQTTPEVHRRLSTKELEYMTEYSRIVDKALDESLLDKLPEHLRSLTDTDSSGLSMVEEPDLERFCFANVLEDIGLFQLDTGEEIDLSKDDTIVIRYKAIRELVEQGKVKLM